MTLKNSLCTAVGVGGAYISRLFGGWSAGLTTLCIFMAFDYITGLVVAAVFGTSPKTENGGLESRAGFKGLARKGVILAIVLISYRLDLLIGTSYIKDAVIIAFCANELISLAENAGLMGIPIPKTITRAIEILNDKGDGNAEN